jgi:hypothetical protein
MQSQQFQQGGLPRGSMNPSQMGSGSQFQRQQQSFPQQSNSMMMMNQGVAGGGGEWEQFFSQSGGPSPQGGGRMQQPMGDGGGMQSSNNSMIMSRGSNSMGSGLSQQGNMAPRNVSTGFVPRGAPGSGPRGGTSGFSSQQQRPVMSSSAPGGGGYIGGNQEPLGNASFMLL